MGLNEEPAVGAASLFSRPATDAEIRLLLERAIEAADVELPDDVRHQLRQRLAEGDPPRQIANWLVARVGWGDNS
jgi:hypothetical protein